MERKDFDEKFEEMVEGVTGILRHKADELWKSGGVDTEIYWDNFLLPKIIMCAALDYVKYQYMPHHPDDRRAVKNLGHF